MKKQYQRTMIRIVYSKDVDILTTSTPTFEEWQEQDDPFASFFQ